MITRRSSGLALSAVLALVVAACSTTEGTPAASAPAPDGSAPAASPGGSAPAGSPGAGGADISGDLQVLARYGCEPAPCEPSGEGAADEIAYTRYNVFAEQYPDVTLDFTESDFDAQGFLTSVAAGNPPDVVRMDRAIIGTYIAEGALEPLDQCISNMGIDMSQYRTPAVDAVTVDGAVYGIPEFYDSRIILVNDSVVEDAGLTSADIDTSDWDKLAQVNEQLLQKDGDTPSRIGFDPKLPEFLPLWAKANGADIVSADGKTS